MPGQADHENKATANEACFKHLMSVGQFPEWEITLLFYAALHYVDAVLAKHLGSHPGNHSERNAAIGKVSGLKSVWTDYRELQDRSRDARYTTAQLPTPQSLESKHYARLRAAVLGLL